MRDGNYVIFQLQHRKTHETPWLKTEDPLKEIPGYKRHEWGTCGIDHWDRSMRTEDNRDQLHEVWSCTGHAGFFELKEAAKAYKRLVKHSSEEMYDLSDSYGKIHQRCGYEFRIIKVTMSQKTDVVSIEDLILSL